MSKKFQQHKRNSALELAQFKRKHTFDKSCIKCSGIGYLGRIKQGDRKGLYVACTCAKPIKKGLPHDIP